MKKDRQFFKMTKNNEMTDNDEKIHFLSFLSFFVCFHFLNFYSFFVILECVARQAGPKNI